jgi:8-amino-7-oxononanoate synthase
VQAAAELLAARQHGRPALLVTESIFSVDGDLAPLAELHAVARATGALLLVDDAHGLGVIGPNGAGGVVDAGIAGEPDVVVTATLSKALGGAGGVIAGPHPLVRHLIDTGRTFIYDTALPPSTAAGVAAALALARDTPVMQVQLHDRAGYLRYTLADAGLVVTTPAGGVISVRAENADHALAWAAACREQGVAVGCFRPPSTPDGSSRLRLTVNVGVPRDEFDWAVSIIRKVRP